MVAPESPKCSAESSAFCRPLAGDDCSRAESGDPLWGSRGSWAPPPLHTPGTNYSASRGKISASIFVRNIGKSGEKFGSGSRLWLRLIQGPGTDYRARGYCSCNLCHPLHQHRQVNEITGNASDTSTGVQDGAEPGQLAVPASHKNLRSDSYNHRGSCGGRHTVILAVPPPTHTDPHRHLRKKEKTHWWDNYGFCPNMIVRNISLPG